MIPISILCGCGQKYTFEVEPVDGRMPSTVACPACGADGTSAANEGIALRIGAEQPATSPATATSLRVRSTTEESAPTGVPGRGPGRLPGQVGRGQAECEARAKASWGEPPEEVLKYLMIQGFTHQEASILVKELYRERAAEIRIRGFIKIGAGLVLICIPILTFFGGVRRIKFFALTIMVGLWGAWMLINGVFMVVAPRMEGGDVAEH